jgi:hypothetical protein
MGSLEELVPEPRKVADVVGEVDEVRRLKRALGPIVMLKGLVDVDVELRLGESRQAGGCDVQESSYH